MSPLPAVAVALDPQAPVAEDPVWAAMLASPVAEDDLSEEERAALEEGMQDIRAGRVVGHKDVAMIIQRMRLEQGE